MNRLDRFVGLLFGSLLFLALLFISVIHTPSNGYEKLTFRVLLSVAAAAVGSFFPGFGILRFPQMRIGGAFVIAIAVYILNPSTTIANTLDFRATQSIRDAKYLIYRGNDREALSELYESERAARLLPDSYFYAAIIDRHSGFYSQSLNEMRRALKIYLATRYSATDITEADIFLGIGLTEENMGNDREAYTALKKGVAVARPDSLLKGDLSYELGRMAFARWFKQRSGSDEHLLISAARYFDYFNHEPWPHQQAMIWGNYYRSCIFRELASLKRKRSVRLLLQKEAAGFQGAFWKVVANLRGQRKYELEVMIALMIRGVGPLPAWAPPVCEVRQKLAQFVPQYITLGLMHK